MDVNIYSLLDKLNYSNLILVGRTLLYIINKHGLISDELSQDTMDIVNKCYEVYEKNGNVDDILDYINKRVDEEIGTSCITNEDIDQLLEK